MVTAAPIKKKRSRIAVFLYAIALFTLLFALSYLLYQYIGEYNNLINNRDAYASSSMSREKLISEFEQNAVDFTKAQEEINNEADLSTRMSLLTQSIEAVSSQIDLIEEVKEIDDELLKLNLTAEERAEIEEIQRVDIMYADLYGYYLETLQTELNVTDYNIALATSNNCLNGIDFSQSNEEISTKITECMQDLHITTGKSMALGSQFPNTIEYIKQTSQYWDTTRQLYDALAQEQREQATTLRTTQDAQGEKVKEYSAKSVTEIEKVLSNRISTISALEAELQ
ncbi:MAG: hypothetical protein QY318_04415 [Candidatus Dojkabacteria bacterium]|nr:MAG: hypothetical protein QY318_04415 [Candidatus Dojkabacteria bacterium]